MAACVTSCHTDKRSCGSAHPNSALMTHAGPFAKKQRMFSWNAPATYYAELATPKLEGPIRDQESENFYRVDPPPHVGAASASSHQHHAAALVVPDLLMILP